MTARPSRARLWLFAFGDFAFNLYWQSVMLFLLFYYTEALGLPLETASLTYLVASIWDGIANLLAGILADRRRASAYRRALVLGAAPLGLAFVLAYLPPPIEGGWAIAMIVGGHMLFRTAYAFLNVPYLAMHARVSADDGDRALVAGLRVLFGTAAVVVVSLGTQPIGRWILGPGAAAYLGAAILFGILGAAILAVVGSSFRDALPSDRGQRPGVRACLAGLAANRAFVTLNLATTAMAIGSTLLSKSVLYWFKYGLGDEAAGAEALATMGVVGALAVPLWIVLSRRTGARALWFGFVIVASILLAAFGGGAVAGVGATTAWLVAIQVVMVGFSFAFWALLPNTVEFGERTTGFRAEGTIFGVAALLQRVAIGLATALLGLGFGQAGFEAGVAQSAETLAAMRWTIAGLPAGFFLLSGAVMLMNPLTRETHARVLADLAARRADVARD